MKANYPHWNDRVKQIHRLWRGLRLDQRKEYVDKARLNRAGRAKGPRRSRISTKPGGGNASATIKKEEEQFILIKNQITSVHDAGPSTSQMIDIKQEVNQQSNGIHPSSSNVDIRSIANGILSQQPIQQHQHARHASPQVKEQTSFAHIQQQHPSTSNGQQGNAAPNSNQQNLANGAVIKSQPTTNGPSVPKLTPEIVDRFVALQKDHESIKQQQSVSFIDPIF